MLTKEKKDIILKDKIVNILFTEEETLSYIEAIVAAALNVKFEEIHGNLKLQTPRVNSNVKTQYSMADAVFEKEDAIINVEVNYINYKGLHVKNLKYVFHLILKQLKINEEYDGVKPVYQININNFDKFKKNKFIYNSHISEDETHEIWSNLLNIIDINIDFLKKIDYNLVKEGKDNSLERLLYILICDNEEMKNELYKGDEMMKKVIKKIDSLTEDFDEELYYNYEEILNNYSYDLGVEKGIEQYKNEIAKSMLKDKMPKEVIIKYTGLSEEELNKISKE